MVFAQAQTWVYYVLATPDDPMSASRVLDDANRTNSTDDPRGNSLVRSMTFDVEAARIGKAVSHMTCKPELGRFSSV